VTRPPSRPAQALLIPSIMPQLLYSGYLIQRSSVQPYFLEFWYISFFRYSFTVLAVNEFEDGHFAPCANQLVGGDDYCPYGNGRVERSFVVTDVLSFDENAIPRFYYVMLGYLALLLFLTYYTLRYQARRKYG